MKIYENNQDDFASYFEYTPDLVFIASKDGFFKRVNTAVINTLGYSREEILSRPINSFIYPDDIEKTNNTRLVMFEGEPLVNFENRYISKLGEIVWLHWTSFYIPNKESVFAIAKNITGKKEKEFKIETKYREIQKLATQFKKNIEKDRKRFAEDLHEELAQLAAVIKMNLTIIKNSLPDISPTIKNSIEQTSGLSELLIKTIREISFEISPYMLDYDCLKDALSALCTNFSRLHGIPCMLETEFDESVLGKEIKIDFYRICQEALKNVIDHSQAQTVTISIKENVDKVKLTIFDNGKGFDQKKENQKSGLSIIRDRVLSINGHIRISSKPGEGTVISVMVDKMV